MVESYSITPMEAKILMNALINRKNILISGIVGIGKTTFMNALLDAIPVEEKVVAIGEELSFERKHFMQIQREDILFENTHFLSILSQAGHNPYIAIDELQLIKGRTLISLLERKERALLMGIHSVNNPLATLTSRLLGESTGYRLRETFHRIGEQIDIVIHINRTGFGVRNIEIKEVIEYNDSQRRFIFREKY